MTPVLELAGVAKRFGSLTALQEVSVDVADGERVALIGPNGAGKTTLFGVIAGRHRPSAGRVRFRGRDITRLAEHRRARLGIATTFQTSALFDDLTAADNLALAVGRRLPIARRLLPRGPDIDAAARLLLEPVQLQARANTRAGALSHGERRRLEIALALATDPTLLLLDEPAAGLSPDETAELVALISALPDDLTVLLIEHDLDVVFAVARRVVVLHLGRVLADGNAADVRANAAVQEAYLGGVRLERLFER